jgi:hypothetical protein
MVLCDVLGHHQKPISHSPRAMLKAQIARLTEMGFSATMATELEFFLFEKSFAEISKSGFRDLTPISAYNEDYNILQTTKEEVVMRPLRNHLYAMGIPIEGSKGEAEAGQEELNIKYDEALACADHHSIAKHAVKEIAWQHGHAATFLPKWSQDRVGSSSHVHQSLWKEGKPAFFDADRREAVDSEEEGGWGAADLSLGDDLVSLSPVGKPRSGDEDKEAQYAAIIADSKKWLAASREALCSVGGAGAAPSNSDEWLAEATRRWGPRVADVACGDWEAYVNSRISHPPPPSPMELLQEF